MPSYGVASQEILSRCLDEERQKADLLLEKQQHLLETASVTEGVLRRQLGEAQADAAAWRDAAQHGTATGEVRELHSCLPIPIIRSEGIDALPFCIQGSGVLVTDGL